MFNIKEHKLYIIGSKDGGKVAGDSATKGQKNIFVVHSVINKSDVEYMWPDSFKKEDFEIIPFKVDSQVP